jgi:hypothetical protein
MATRLWIPRRILNLQRPCLEQKNLLLNIDEAEVAQSVQCLIADWTTGVRYAAEQIIFPVLSVSRLVLRPTEPPVQWVSGILSPGLNGGRGVTLTIHSHVVPRKGMISSCTSCPPSACLACCETALAFISVSRPALRTTQPPGQWVTCIHSRE